MYVQQNVSYFWGYLVPPCSLILAIIMFLVGRQSYILRLPAGSVLATTLSIVKEAIKKSRRPAHSSLIVNHWLDRAKQRYGGTYSNWEVEDVKKVYRLLPIFGTFILYWTVSKQVSVIVIVFLLGSLVAMGPPLSSSLPLPCTLFFQSFLSLLPCHPLSRTSTLSLPPNPISSFPFPLHSLFPITCSQEVFLSPSNQISSP